MLPAPALGSGSLACCSFGETVFFAAASLRGVSAGGGGMLSAPPAPPPELLSAAAVALAADASTDDRLRREARGSATGESAAGSTDDAPSRSLWSSPLVSPAFPVLKNTGDGGTTSVGPTMPRKWPAQLCG